MFPRKTCTVYTVYITVARLADKVPRSLLYAFLDFGFSGFLFSWISAFLDFYFSGFLISWFCWACFMKWASVGASWGSRPQPQHLLPPPSHTLLPGRIKSGRAFDAFGSTILFLFVSLSAPQALGQEGIHSTEENQQVSARSRAHEKEVRLGNEAHSKGCNCLEKLPPGSCRHEALHLLH